MNNKETLLISSAKINYFIKKEAVLLTMTFSEGVEWIPVPHSLILPFLNLGDGYSIFASYFLQAS